MKLKLSKIGKIVIALILLLIILIALFIYYNYNKGGSVHKFESNYFYDIKIDYDKTGIKVLDKKIEEFVDTKRKDFIATVDESGRVETSKYNLIISATNTEYKNINSRKAFTVSIADAKHVVEADYFGVVSGNNTKNKFENSNLTATKSEIVDAPIINEFPICMECEFVEYQDDQYGCGVIGKIVNVSALESVMNGDNVDVSLVNAIAFDPYTHGYYKVSERVGNAFKDGLQLKK